MHWEDFQKTEFQNGFEIILSDSSNIVLKFEINSIDTAKKLEYFYDENVNLSYDQN